MPEVCQIGPGVLAPQERWDEARAEFQRALELDPLSKTVAGGKAFLAYLRRDWQTSIAEFQENLGTDPQPLDYAGLLGALSGAKRFDEAMQIAKRMGPMAKAPMQVVLQVNALAHTGRLPAAGAALRELDTPAPGFFVSEGTRSIGYAAIGEVDEALRHLRLARQEQASLLIFLRVGVFFDPLRGDRRFESVLAEVGLSDRDLGRRREAREAPAVPGSR